MRFYSQDERTCRVRWYRVPRGTPWVPYRNSFVSSNWDSDPDEIKPIGEVRWAPRTYYHGAPPAAFSRDHVCGTPDQWLHGQPFPPGEPVQVNDQGVPLCCGEAPAEEEEVSVPADLRDDLALWLRPEELPDYSEGAAIYLWEAAPPTTRPGWPDSLITAPRFVIDAATAQPGGFFTRSPQRALRTDLSLEGDLTAYLIGRPSSASPGANRPGPSLFDAEGGDTLAVQGTRYFIRIGGDTRVSATTLAPGESHVWTFRRSGSTVTIAQDGATVVTEHGLPAGPIHLRHWGATMAVPLNALACWMPEVLVFSRALTADEDARVREYLAGKYGV